LLLDVAMTDQNDSSMAEEYQDKLSESVDDGGGCAETWDALSKIRETKTDTKSRRSVIKSAAGALGVSAASLAGLTETAAATTSAINVEEKEGSDKNRVVARALRDKRVKKIAHKLRNEGYTPQINEARVTSSKVQTNKLSDEERSKLPDGIENADDWKAVVIPFGPTEEEEQVNITWSTASKPTNQVVGRQSIRIVPEDGSEPYWDIQNYTIDENGEVLVESDTMPNFLGCDNPSTGCISLIAAAYGSEIIACATCGASAGWLIAACGYCITAVLAAYGTSVTCDWCND